MTALKIRCVDCRELDGFLDPRTFDLHTGGCGALTLRPLAFTRVRSGFLTRPEAIRAMMETILHILSKDVGERPPKKAKRK